MLRDIPKNYARMKHAHNIQKHDDAALENKTSLHTEPVCKKTAAVSQFRKAETRTKHVRAAKDGVTRKTTLRVKQNTLLCARLLQRVVLRLAL